MTRSNINVRETRIGKIE